MASILFDMDRERQELQDRLKDFDNLEKNLYPEIKGIVEGDMGCDCVVSLCQNDASRCYNSFRIGVQKNNETVAIVEVKFASATPTGDYKVTRISTDGKTAIEHEMCGRPDLMDIIESMLVRSLGVRSAPEDYEDDNVADAKECKKALDKYVLGLNDMKKYKLKTVLTKDVSVGAEMPTSRVELGSTKKGKFEPYFTFDFSGGMCHITFHLVNEDWDEDLNDHPSVDSMIDDLVPDILDEIEN